MKPTAIIESGGIPRLTPHELPPLILSPFDHRHPDEQSPSRYSNPVTQRHMNTCYNELRMLCLIGKDLDRWLGQCVEAASVDPELAALSECDFIAALLFSPPTAVLQKMQGWGVRNFQIIFSRAIGLNTVFPHPPLACDVSESFLLRFNAYADALYDARLMAEDRASTGDSRFTFEIYSSAEYSCYLEKSWGE